MSKAATYLAKLFRPSDLIYVCGSLVTDEAGSRYTDPRVISANQPDLLPSHLQFCVNPLSPINRNPNPSGSRRHSSNVAMYRNFLLESDSLPLETQRLVLPILAEKLPVKLAIYSGGKSIHFIVSLADDLTCGRPGTPEANELYKMYWKGLEAYASRVVSAVLGDKAPAKIFDGSTKDVVRLARIPEAKRPRVQPETTRELGQPESTRPPETTLTDQSVLYEGSYITSEQLFELASQIERSNFGPVVNPNPNMSLSSFATELRARKDCAALQLWLLNFENYARPEGMYHVMFRLALWAHDLTGVPYETLELYLREHVYPILKAVGYPRDPSVGVFNAYKWKGLI